MLPIYDYADLPTEGECIRLLIVAPGHKEDYIYCRLEPVMLADVQGTYECISYVWGSNTETRRIVVDGQSFPVTLNLFHALQHFRLLDRERILWADAICISQMNYKEKGAQVQLMGKIYEHGLKTLVWLGVDRDGTAQETADFFGETSEAARGVCEKYGGVDKIPNLSSDENPFSQDARKWGLFQEFIGFPWFTRTWVIQEVGIARDVSFHWGDVEIKLSDVINVNEIQRHAPHIFSVLVFSWSLHDIFNGVFMTYKNEITWRDQVVQDFLAQNRKLVPHQSVLDILLQSSRRDVTDKRDHIYAFLAHPLLMMGGETIVHADYKRKADDVFLDVTAKVLKKLDATLTLGVAGGMGQRRDRNLDGDQPSWVIQWDLGRGCFTMGRLEQWYCAGVKGTTADIKIDSTSKTLRMPAVIFDTIVWTSDQIQESQVQLDMLACDPDPHIAMDEIWKALPEEPCCYTGKHGSRDAYTMSLVCGAHGHRYPAEEDLAQHRRLSSAYLDFAKSLTSSKASAAGAGNGNEGLRKDAREFENDFALFAKARRLVVTEKGFYGLGPQLVRKGDVVAVVPGLRVCFVLRPTNAGGEEKYKWVGSAYVHGVMRGEVLDESDPLGLNAGKPKEIIVV